LLLSIIIPVYNVEDYIEKCILSLQDQDILTNEYEIIIINDGSPDNSRDIILGLEKKAANIVFIDQENMGVSTARNRGIKAAKGKYIVFIDPDDYVVVGSLRKILDSTIAQNAQVAFLGYKFLNADNSVKKEILYRQEEGKIFIGIQAYFIARGDGTVDPDRSVGILFERSYINENNLEYIKDVPYLEDGEFLVRVLCLAERCIFSSDPFYIRTTRPGSATNSNLFYSDRAIEGFIKASANLLRYRQTHTLTREQDRFLNQPSCKFILLAANSSLYNTERLKLNDVIQKLKVLGVNKCSLAGCNKYYKRDGFFFNLSPLVYKMYKPVWSMVDNIYFRLFKNHP
jgi:glycosyltransferase involved in cell wall biosynthesis